MGGGGGGGGMKGERHGTGYNFGSGTSSIAAICIPNSIIEK